MEKYFEILRSHGAGRIEIIEASQIVVAPWCVMKCRYGCPNYGHNCTCPPFSPTWQEMRDVLGCYRRALLFCVSDMSKGTPAALACMRALVADGYYKSLAFGTGPCHLCKECKLEDCPRPADLAPSAEACGIDLVATVRGCGLPISVPPVPGEPLHCYGIVLVD